MSNRTNRRRFIQTTAASGVGFWVVRNLHAQDCQTGRQPSSKSPNERIAMACIGLGGKGVSDSADAAKHGDVVAICDVDEGTLNNAGAKRFPNAKRYNDFRKMFDEMGSSIDAVTVSTTDHTHAAAALMAMRMGKHCFCQKPLTKSIYEARLMAKVAKETKVATQMGNQGTALDALRRSVEVVKTGILGPIKEVHVWTNRPIWAQGGERPQPAECPKTLDWDVWLGPAPARPYGNGYHPFAWRGWWDFGTGALGDMACHTVNMPYLALDLRNPTAVQAKCSGHNKDSYPKWSIITFDFPATDKRPALKLFWYDGGQMPSNDLIGGKTMPKTGAIIVGEKDTLIGAGDYAEKQLQLLGGAEVPEVEWGKSPGHFDEWVRAIRGGEPAMSNFVDRAGGLTETILLGNLAVWVAASGEGEKVEWDAVNMKSTNVAGLERIVKPDYRPGYILDEPGHAPAGYIPQPRRRIFRKRAG